MLKIKIKPKKVTMQADGNMEKIMSDIVDISAKSQGTPVGKILIAIGEMIQFMESDVNLAELGQEEAKKMLFPILEKVAEAMDLAKKEKGE